MTSPAPDLWREWAADEITGLSDLDPVTTWIDTSGNGEDLAQANASFQPLYSNATVTQNGLPVVFFSGSEWMASAETAAERFSYSIYLTLSYDTAEEQFQQILRATSNNLPAINIHGNVWTAFPPTTNGRVGFGSFNAIAAYPDAVDGAQILSIHLDHNAGTAAIYRGTSLISGALSYSKVASQTDEDWTIGWSASEHGYAGYMYEITIYRGDRPHNATERDAKVGALATKWGI